MHDTTSPRADDSAIEAEILAKGLTAPRVTAAQIAGLMARIQYVGGRVGETTSTLVHAFLGGSFYLATGHSACVSPENFDAELGFRLARERAERDARDRLWLLEGYALMRAMQEKEVDHKDDVYGLAPHQARVVVERRELVEKMNKLNGFFGTKLYQQLDQDEQGRLSDQFAAMLQYANILDARIAAFSGPVEQMGT